MEEPIVSIYDLMMKRYRQQRKEEIQQQKDMLQQGRQIREAMPKSTSGEPKKTRSRTSRTRLTSQPTASNVVTAMHLTQKQQSIVMPPPTDKTVLSQLVAKMAAGGGHQKPIKKTAEPSAEASAEQLPAIRASSAKKRTARAKARAIHQVKSLHANENGRLQPPLPPPQPQPAQVVLSPRNANRIEQPPTLKLGKFAKVKATSESKVRTGGKSPDAPRPKGRLRTRHSKASVKWDATTEPVDNPMRYRL